MEARPRQPQPHRGVVRHQRLDATKSEDCVGPHHLGGLLAPVRGSRYRVCHSHTTAVQGVLLTRGR